MPCSIRWWLLQTSALFAVAAGATGQGSFVNFETPPVRPAVMAVVSGFEYLVVCNTPDDSIEIYDPATPSAGTIPAFLLRVGVGQGPVSVRFDPVTSCLYTANHVGDSVTRVRLTKPGSVLRATVEATKAVGDAPADIAVSADGSRVFVTLSGNETLVELHAATLDPAGTPDPLPTPSGLAAVKEPRRIEVRNGEPWVLNHKGGNGHVFPPGSGQVPAPAYDLDLWTRNPATAVIRTAGFLGTTNSAMAFGADGRLYIVGSLARNEVLTKAALRPLATAGTGNTGFVQSFLWVVDPQSLAVVSGGARDLNRDAAGAAVNPAQACSQPADLALVQGAASVDKIYVAAFGSDRLVVLTPSAAAPATWPRAVIDIPITPQPGDYGRNGPRGLVLNAARTRLYCVNQLSNSVSVIDVASDVHAVRFRLRSDPTPGIVREGRRFLYSAEFSGNQTVACSSCHVDARTDSLAWDVGDVGLPATPHPPGLQDVVRADGTSAQVFPSNKGEMVTQTLQGLVNHPLNPEGQDFMTNKPYYWRAAQPDFTAFNAAFVALMGAADLPDPPQQTVNGVSASDMAVFRDMINTVMNMPNPEQHPRRVFRGTLWTNADDVLDGTSALRGLKAFHIFPIEQLERRSCVQCHWLPEGSNNRITESAAPGGTETAAVRALRSREGRKEAPAPSDGSSAAVGASDVMTASAGLRHDGQASHPAPITAALQDGPLSIDRFVIDSFANFHAVHGEVLKDVALFIREFDAGIAPSVGYTHSVTMANAMSQETMDAFDLLEDQVRKANCGFAVQARISGAVRGYWFDVTAVPEGYRRIGTNTVLSLAALRALPGPQDLLVLQGTPAGSERRIASPSGHPGILTGPPPVLHALEPLTPATPWTLVPTLTKNWDPLTPSPLGFDFNTGIPPGTFLEPRSLRTLRLLQRAVIQFWPSAGFTRVRHEAPRRFRVSGDDIRVGAKLRIRVPDPTTETGAPQYVDIAANTTLIETGLYPTNQFASGHRIWETTAEIDPLMLYVLILGGPKAPGVATALDDPFAASMVEATPFAAGTFRPDRWNQHHVTIVNEDQSASPGAWLPLRLP